MFSSLYNRFSLKQSLGTPVKCPHPWGFAIQEKKNANACGLAGGGGGAWAQLDLTDA